MQNSMNSGRADSARGGIWGEFSGSLNRAAYAGCLLSPDLPVSDYHGPGPAGSRSGRPISRIFPPFWRSHVNPTSRKLTWVLWAGTALYAVALFTGTHLPPRIADELPSSLSTSDKVLH